MSACSQDEPVGTEPAIQVTETSSTAALPADNSVLYRGDLGRMGNFDLPSLETPVEVRWQRPVGPSVHGAPMLVGNTLLVPTVAARFVALDAESGEEKWTFTASGDLFSPPPVVDKIV